MNVLRARIWLFVQPRAPNKGSYTAGTLLILSEGTCNSFIQFKTLRFLKYWIPLILEMVLLPKFMESNANNEFVFTADAVRAAGGGSVNKGAQRMYGLMKQLESGIA